jgi:polyvinyl alcohol dehydrogenase (cytochrome)
MCGAILASAALLGSHPALGQAGSSWTFSGGGVNNTRNAANESIIGANNVSGLKVKWALATHGDVSATPTVETDGAGGTTVYAVDWGGYLYSINGNTGSVNWSSQIKTYTGNTVLSASRTSPAIVGNTLVFGDQGDVASSGFPQQGGATASVMAVNKTNGNLVWRTVVSDHPFSVISSSPVAYNGVVYVGVASLEENAGFLGAWPFSWRGKVVALDAGTGSVIWSIKTIDDASYNNAQGYTGASVWGSTPVVDPKRGTLYVSTGNNYTGPAGGSTSPGSPAAPAGDHFDSVLALDLSTGATKWAYRAWNGDVWDVASWVFGGAKSYNYPDNSLLGPDWDFGSGPMLISGNKGDIIGAGAKSGIFYALDPDTGALIWKTQAGPGGTGGGIEWGSASDGKYVYCAITNSDYKPNLGGSGGNWTSIDASTGKVRWMTADPLYPGVAGPNTGGGHDPGMVTVANDVVFAGSSGLPGGAPGAPNGAPGGFFAMHASNGKILWQFTSADDPDLGSVNSGASVVNGVVYWGSGYSHLLNAFGISGHQPKLYAFSLH